MVGLRNKDPLRAYPGGEGATLYTLYRYVPPRRVGSLRRFGLKTSIHFVHFGLESGMVFKGTTGVYERIYRFNSKCVRKGVGEGGGGGREGETDANSKWIWRICCLRSNLKAVITKFLPKGPVWKRVSGFVRFFLTKNSRTFQRLSRTHFAFFNDCIQCKTRALSLCLLLVLPHQRILSRRSLCLLHFLCSSP